MLKTDNFIMEIINFALLNVANVLNALNMLSMPNDASLVFRALFQDYMNPNMIGCVGTCAGISHPLSRMQATYVQGAYYAQDTNVEETRPDTRP